MDPDEKPCPHCGGRVIPTYDDIYGQMEYICADCSRSPADEPDKEVE